MIAVLRLLSHAVAAMAVVTFIAITALLFLAPQSVGLSSAVRWALAETLARSHWLLPSATAVGCCVASFRAKAVTAAVRRAKVATSAVAAVLTGSVLALAALTVTPRFSHLADSLLEASYRADAPAWLHAALSERLSVESARYSCSWKDVGTDGEGFTVLREVELTRHGRTGVTRAREAGPRISDDGRTLHLTLRDLVHDDLVASARLDLTFALESLIDPPKRRSPPATSWAALHLAAALLGVTAGRAGNRFRASREDARAG